MKDRVDNDRRTKYMNQVAKSNNSDKNDFIDISLDSYALDILCKMVLSRNKLVRRTQLMNIIKLLDLINPAAYKNDPYKLERYNFIRKGVEARLGLNIDDPYMIMQHINGGLITGSIYDNITIFYIFISFSSRAES